MSLKELIIQDIQNLSPEELAIIFDQLQLMKHIKRNKTAVQSHMKIRELTSASKINWSDDILKERYERL